jgi:basic amino acid/polyamine antiporter, APA family
MSTESTTSIPAASPGAQRGHLLRILGVGFGLSVAIGNTIGYGILRLPGEIAAHLASRPLIYALWLVGGVYALLCASSVTELGVMLPRAGGWYVYAQRAFGEHVGFVVGCCDWMMQSVANAALASGSADFSAALYPGLAPHHGLVGVTILGVLGILNWVGLRSGSRTQELTSLAKALGLLGLVAACFFLSPHAPVAGPRSVEVELPKESFLFAVLASIQAIIVAYDGWYAPIYFSEEDESPSVNLPRSMIGGVSACIVIFLLVNAALFYTLPMGQLRGAQAPAADAAMVVLGSYGKRFILALSLVATLSAINAGILLSPRILFGMARDRLLPSSVATVNKGGTPGFALLLCTAASVSLVLSGTLDSLVAIVSILYVSVYATGFASLLVLRHREPQLARSYGAWWYPWSTIVVLLASLAFLAVSVIGDLKHSLFTLILVALTFPAYQAIRKWRTSRPASA